MARSFKFQHVNLYSGAFVLLALVLLAAAVFLTGRAQKWFEPRLQVPIHLPEEGSYGLKVGAEVQVMGTVVGSVRDIEFDDSGKMVAQAMLIGDFTRFVRQDSEAIIKKKFGVAGDAYVEITRGTGEPLGPDAVLQGKPDVEILQRLEWAVEEIRTQTVPLIQQIKATAEEYASLATTLRDEEGPLMQLLEHLNAIAEGLEQGRGTAGMLLQDDSMARETQTLLKESRMLIEATRSTVSEVNRAAATLPDLSATLREDLQQVPSVVRRAESALGQAESALEEAERLLQGLQNHWLVRNYVPERASDPAGLQFAPDSLPAPASGDGLPSIFVPTDRPADPEPGGRP